MTTKQSRTPLRLALMALLAGCTWGSKPELPGNGQDGASAADGLATFSDAVSMDAALEDVPLTPDVPPPPPLDAPVAFDSAPAPDASPPPFDAFVPDAAATDECRFVPATGGTTPPNGAVVVDGGYFANSRGEGCDPTPRFDAGMDGRVDASDAGDAGDGSEGGRP